MIKSSGTTWLPTKAALKPARETLEIHGSTYLYRNPTFMAGVHQLEQALSLLPAQLLATLAC